MIVHLPETVKEIIARLNARGHEAYAVGGCVRDSVMGVEPEDWDVTTSATPGEVKACFERVVETGAAHGTVTVNYGGMPVEVTTFRVDGAYSDSRHPDSVTFTRRLEDDLARRDFTINAMAFHPRSGIVDPFGGQGDIRRKCVRCVGDAHMRFEEDALRILRALRFASALGFTLDAGTAEALRLRRGSLTHIAAERVQSELNKLLCGKAVRPVMEAYAGVIGVVLPEILPCVGFEQHSVYHCYDVYGHTLRALEQVDPQKKLRLAVLLHDIGKPASFTMGKDGRGHFYGHAHQSVALAQKILSRLKYDNATQNRVLTLVKYHDADIQPEKPSVKRWMRLIGAEAFEQTLEVMRADALAQQAQSGRKRLERIAQVKAACEAVLANGECYELSGLALKGGDLLEAGIAEGPALGGLLVGLLERVIDGELPNEREALLQAAKGYKIGR